MPLVRYSNVQTSDPEHLAEVEIETGAEISTMSDNAHSHLRELDFLSSGHTGFAGIEVHDTAYWESIGSTVIAASILLVYTDYYELEDGTYSPGVKIANGVNTVEELPFVSMDVSEVKEMIEDETARAEEAEGELSERIDELEKTGFDKEDISTNSIAVQYTKSTSNRVISTNVVWDNRISATNQRQLASAYGNGYFVSCGENSSIIYSTDGITWTSVSGSPTGVLKYLCFGNGYFLLISYTTRKVYKAYTPTLWEEVCKLELIPKSLQYINNKFIVTCSSGWVLSSSNGSNWEKEQLPTSNNILSITYGNNKIGKYLAVGENGETLYSYNGKTWVVETITPDTNTLISVIYANGLYLVNTGTTIKYSINGYTWYSALIPVLSGFTIKKIIYGEGRFYAIVETGNNDGQIWVSDDGKIYTLSYTIGFIPNTISYGDGTYVVTGDNGQICSLSMNIIWTYEKPTLEDNEYLWGRNVSFSTNGDERYSNAYYIYIPRKVSELANDAGYINKYVDDLEYYYTKTQTDTLLDEKVNYSDDIPTSDIDIIFDN